MLCGSTLEANAAELRGIFDAKYYADLYPDLKAAFGDDEQALYLHFLVFGLKEGRVMNPILDVAKYREQYADLNAAFGDNWDLYVEHFFTYGVEEHRDNGTDFDLLAYLAAYGDIAEAFGTDYEAVARHYAQTGIHENRQEGSKTALQRTEETAADDNSAAAGSTEGTTESSTEGESQGNAEGKTDGSAEGGSQGSTGETTTNPDDVEVEQRTGILENGYKVIFSINAKGNTFKASYYDGDELVAYSTYKYDAAGNLTEQAIYTPAGTLDERSVYEYDANGNNIKAMYYDAEGLNGYVEYVYSEDNKCIRRTFYYPSGITERCDEYDKDGNTLKRSDYDEEGELTFCVEYIYENGVYKGFNKIK